MHGVGGCAMLGIDAKKSTASSTSIFSTSPMLFPRQLTASVSALKRSPWQTSQVAGFSFGQFPSAGRRAFAAASAASVASHEKASP